MSFSANKKWIAVVGMLLLACATAQASALLDPLYCSGMVLQRDAPVIFSGKGTPGERIVLRFANLEEETKVSHDGRWSIRMHAFQSGGPFELSVHSAGEQVKLGDVWIGDVWVASGQSNMEMELKIATGGSHEAARPLEGTLRIWNVEKLVARDPQLALRATWRRGEGDAALGFSAVGYHFGRKIAEETQVPIGVINASWGGTPIQSWTRMEVLSGDTDFVPILKRWGQTLKDYPAAKAKWDETPQAQRETEYRRRAAEARRKGLPKVYPEWPPQGPDSPQAPAVLWNGMIHPLTRLPIKGVIWYQGESNAPYAEQYAKLFPSMIRDWRTQWNIGEFPFYYVQLCNFNAFRLQVAEPVESSWAELREAQDRVRGVVHRTGMAVTIDVGEEDQIHPRDKKTVGERLALLALKNDYGRNVICEGPRFYRLHKVIGGVEIEFTSVADGLRTRSGANSVKAFAVASEDRKFRWAEAQIIGPSRVFVKKPSEIEKIEAIRYNWGDTPGGDLYNSADLPAEPFRTDKWPGATAGKR